MVKSAVQVCVRTRPTSRFAEGLLDIDTADSAVKIHIPKSNDKDYINNQQEDWKFKFHHVLDNVSQEAVYDTCASDIVDSVLEGYNGTILAYGQTGAGKTFTMCGGSQSYKYRGIIPRAVSHVFHHIESNPQFEFIVRISYLEVYNECFYDLLQSDGGNIGDLAVREDDEGVVSVKGLTKSIVGSEEDALNILFNGETNRSIAEHQMNKSSTRSHCIFTIHIERRSRVESSEKVIYSKLNLVDLAGSERVGKTNSKGAILEEAKYINKSLTFLEQVVIALSSKNRDHIPFRQSKLTNVLRDSLGGNCKTRLIANIWSEKEQLEETISTLKFATRMMRVSNDAIVNIKMDPQQLLRKYEREIRHLKQELQMHDNLANRGTVVYDDYTPEQQMELQKTVVEYVNGDLEEIPIQSLKQVRELFVQFRHYIQAMGSRPMGTVPGAKAEGKEVGDGAGGAGSQAQANGESVMVGGIDENVAGGFTLGVAPSHAAPPSPSSPSPASPRSPTAASPRGPTPSKPASASASASASAGNAAGTGMGASSASPPAEASEGFQVPRANAPNETQAFEEYKKNEGATLNDDYNENKKSLKVKKAQLKDLGEKLNAAKRNIDRLNIQIQEKRDKRRGGLDEKEEEVEIIDEEEYALIRQVKEEKKTYQAHFHDRKMLQSEVTYLKGLVEQSKRALANSFLDFFNQHYGGDATEERDERGPIVGEDIHAGSNGADGGVDDTDQSVLDDAEAFDRLERQRVMAEDPDSVAFFNARKAAAGHKKGAGKVVKGKGTRKGFM